MKVNLFGAIVCLVATIAFAIALYLGIAVMATASSPGIHCKEYWDF